MMTFIKEKNQPCYLEMNVEQQRKKIGHAFTSGDGYLEEEEREAESMPQGDFEELPCIFALKSSRVKYNLINIPYSKMIEKLRHLSGRPSLPGLEPGTSGLEVQRARPLRHRDLTTSSASGPELKKHIPSASLPNDSSILLFLYSIVGDGRGGGERENLEMGLHTLNSSNRFLPASPHPLALAREEGKEGGEILYIIHQISSFRQEVRAKTRS